MPTDPAPADSPKIVLHELAMWDLLGPLDLHLGWISAECFDVLLNPLQSQPDIDQSSIKVWRSVLPLVFHSNVRVSFISDTLAVQKAPSR